MIIMKKLMGFFLLFPLFLQAQEIYDLEKCIETGLAYNYDIRIVRNNQQIAENNVTIGNAGYLPTLDFSTDYSGTLNNLQQQYPTNGDEMITSKNILNDAVNLGINLNWTVFDGLAIQTNHTRLKELQEMGELNTRLAIENFIAEIAGEYYNYLQQNIQFNNLKAAVDLSKERLRIVEANYNIGSMSRLDLQQARVDFNTDSSRLVKQREMVFSSKIMLNTLMGLSDVEKPVMTNDTIIVMDTLPTKEELWQHALQHNAFLLLSEKEIYLSRLDLKTLQSVNYPYLRINAGYGYTHSRNHNQLSFYNKQNTLGLNYGVTLGIRIFDGTNRTRQQNNARITIENRKLEYDQLLLNIKGDFSNLWMAYQNNMALLNLEADNVKTAEDNYENAIDRYKLGDLSGIELREAQNSLLEAEERLVQAQYNTKLCEISLLQISGRISALLN